MSTIDDFFSQNEGGSPVASFDFKGRDDAGIGLSVAGEIVDVAVRDITDPNTGKVRTDKNDKVMQQFVITLQTNLRDYVGAKKPVTDSDGTVVPDDGTRRVYLRYQGARALVDAVKTAGATSKDLRGGVGAKLAVKRIANDGQMNQFEVLFKKGDREPAVEDAFAGFGNDAPSAPAASAPAASNDSPWGSTAPSDDSDLPPF